MASSAAGISEQEAALYDRQIRLWGLDAQKRLRVSKVLVLGVNGLSAEICKNIVLSGIGALTIVDNGTVSVTDLCANFFLSEGDVGKNKAEAILERVRLLNPMVEVKSMKFASLEDVHFSDYNVVCAVDQPLHVLRQLDAKCRAVKVPLYGGRAPGYFGYFFSDCNAHNFIETTVTQLPPDPTNPNAERQTKETLVPRTLSAPTLEEALAVPWSDTAFRRTNKLLFALQVLEEAAQQPNGFTQEKIFELRSTMTKTKGVAASFVPDDLLKMLAAGWRAELSPVCAVVGGILAQDLIKIVTGKDEPISNFFLYNGFDGGGFVERVPSS